ncbi:IS66 family insertion sequence element accessory protein TnpA, partial [Vibrio scophthalmi]
MIQSEEHQYWMAIVTKQQESELSVPNFCKEQDISYPKFHY